MSQITELFKDRHAAILSTWIAQVLDTMRGRISEQELRAELEELSRLLLAALDKDLTAQGELRAALQETSRSRARKGFSPSETAVSVFALKEAVLAELDGAPAEAYKDFAHFSRYIDSLGLTTFETYSAAREQVIADQAEQLLELSTPVVKLWEGIVAVPLVGTLDSARTQVVMETLLQTLVDTGSEFAVIDITGVPAVDTEVAQHLLKTVVAARLMGAECVISGIRPQIAATIVALGIEFGDIMTKASLADALAYLLDRSGAVSSAGAH